MARGVITALALAFAAALGCGLGLAGSASSSSPLDGPEGGADASSDGERPRDPDAAVAPDAPVAGRVPGAIALYGFDEGSGTIVHDTSGVAPAHDLTITAGGATRWIPGALALDGPTLLDSLVPVTKIIGACEATSEVSLEAWVVPANVTQGYPSPARIAGITQDTGTLDVSLSAYGPQYLYRLRTSTSSEVVNDIFTDGGIATTRTHVVLTRKKDGTRRTYVNGAVLVESTLGGDLSTWSSFHLAVGDELTRGRAWLGELHLIAFYDRALTAAEVAQNFAAGP